MKKLAWHFDLHTPGYVRVNTRPDVEAAARMLFEAGVEEVIAFAKCHFGYAYYPTRVGTPHPGMRGDAFGDFQAACQASGVNVLAYISFGIDGQAGEQHPDWCQVGPKGERGKPGHYISVCPFTPYTDDLMLPQIAEVIETYHPHGFFFDTMGAMRPCFCNFCKRDFLEATGKDIPTDPDDPLQAEYGQFRHRRGAELIRRVGAFIQERLPGAKVGFNQIGSLPNPERLPPEINVITLDPPTYGPQILSASLNAAFGSMADRSCDVMPTIFNQGWGDWSLSSDRLLQQVAAAIWARGVRLYMGDRLHPQNRLDRRSMHALKVIGNQYRHMAAEMPPDDAPLAPDVLLLHNTSLTYGPDMSQFCIGNVRDRIERYLGGAHRLLVDAGINFSVVGACYLADRIAQAGLVVVPELPSLERETDQLLRNYVESGGQVLFAGPAPLVDGRPIAWTGLSVETMPWQDHIYLPPWHDEPEVLVRGDFYRATGAETICRAIPAWDARHGHRYGWGIGPAADEASSHPALTRYALGKGVVWSLLAPIFSDHAQNGNWQQVQWCAALFKRMGFPRRAYLETPEGLVELVVYEQGKALWVVLVHHGTEQMVDRWARGAGPLPPVPLRLCIAAKGRQVKEIVCGHKSLPFERTPENLTISLTMDTIWKVVRAEWI